MTTWKTRKTALSLGAAAIGAIVLLGAVTWAAGGAIHCKYVDGPAVEDGKAALEQGDVTPVLKWLGKEDEEEIKALFAKALAVRGKGPEAKGLADQYFIDTLVRLHRRAVGETPYYTINDPAADPVLALVDKAIASSSVDDVTKKVNELVAASLCQKFTALMELRKNKDKSVAAGRKYSEAHANFIRYLHGIHEAVTTTDRRPKTFTFTE